MDHLTFSLPAVPPFRLDFTVWAERRRPDNVMDRWDGRSYRRALLLEGAPVEVAVTQLGPPEDPRLEVVVEGNLLPPGVEPAAAQVLTRVLGTGVDLSPFYRLAAGDPRLGPLAERFRGLKPPRLPSLFETLANAIACQQITLTLGLRLLNRLAEGYGVAVQSGGGVAYTFPRPEDLAGLDPERLREIGYSRQKALSLVALAGAVAGGALDLEGLAGQDDETIVSRLRQLRGVGRWTAEYLLLRGLGRLHIFPGDDVGARNNLQRRLGLPESLDYEGVRRIVAPWQPYAGLVYFHLLLAKLEELGLLGE